MKKIFLVLAIAAVAQVAGAQESVKSPAAAKSAVEKAKAAIENPKQNTKAATWIKYGQALLDAYNSPMGNAWIGMSREEWKLVAGDETPSSEEQVEMGGQQMLKQVYDTRNYYFNSNGRIVMIEVTKPVVDNALSTALEAYRKAVKLDDKGQKSKDIADAVKSIATKYSEEAYKAYYFGDNAKASEMFENAYLAAGTAPYGVLDTTSIYNAASTALSAGDTVRSKKLLEECLEKNYAGSDGDVYAKLALIAGTFGKDKAASKKYLEDGFSKFPQSQVILIGLINYYMTNGENFNRLFELIDDAKKNEPNNASLYYVEGNIHEKLGEEDAAVAAWNKCVEINPAYEFGYIGEGLHFYNKALEIQEKADNEMDDTKYMALIADFEKALKSCVGPFEKAYEITKDQSVKTSVAEYLKNACFRFREDPEFAPKYQKYSAAE